MKNFCAFTLAVKSAALSALKLVALYTTMLVAAGCGNNKEGTQPQIKPLIEAVYASGFVVSKDEYEIIAQVEGQVADKLVQDGEKVKKGDPLYIIASDQQSARYRMAEEAYELAVKNAADNSPILRELTAARESAITKLQFDSTNFVRYSNLLQNNATTKAEFDRVKLAYENSKNEYLLQKSRLEKTKNQLDLDVINTRNNLVIASDEAGRYLVRSEVDGLVFMTAKDKGEMIRRGEIIAVVGKKDAYYLQLNVDELDVQRVKEGQAVLVKIDAYPKNVFHGTVSKVYPMVDRKLQSVRVDADLKEPLPGWFSGLALEANIIIRQKDRAIVIPKTALLPGDSVMIETEEGTQKIKISKGIETLDEVEVLEGLDTSNQLVLAPAEKR